MVALNYARDVRIGSRSVAGVMLGDRQVWPACLEILIRGLYGNGEQGAMYIPQTTVLGQQVLWQDVEGTVPVMSDGDPVGLMLDLSGNGNHASQESSAARPIYRTDGALHWLEFDGADDTLFSPAYSQVSSTSGSLVAGVSLTSGAYLVDADGPSRVAQWVRTSPLVLFSDNESPFSMVYAPSLTTPRVISTSVDALEAQVRIDGSQEGGVTMPSLNQAAEPLRIGGRRGSRTAMKCYGVIQVAAPYSVDAEQYIASLTGVTL